ncbi:MAG: hypothetical protein QOE75_802 [Solirubrobacterales bacterium]|jgi:hypothetical protein|nr:hypothetical protein [Solirubrobacterales bacterium]
MHSRTMALVALAAFAVHQLHFLLSAGTAAGEELRREGYSYLGHIPVTLAALAVTVIAARLLVAYFGPGSTRTGSFGRGLLRHPARFALAILAVYVVQETLEAALFAHHAEDILACLAQGWWLTLALCALLGPIFFLLDRWLGRLEQIVAGFARPITLARAIPDAGRSLSSAEVAVALSPLAFGLARRPPPLSLARQ